MLRRPAFTLLELLLATALAAMLMILILTVTVSVRRTQVELSRAEPPGREVPRLLTMLRTTLSDAHSIQATKDGVTVSGYGRLGRQSLELTQGPTQTEYRVMTVGGRNCLVRQQIELDNTTNQESQVELVMVGVRRLEVESIGRSSGPTTLPSHAWVSMEWEDPDRPAVRELMMLD